ncbi:RNA 2',3'-cyclic phosphodiesterase [SAR202 cluster bacterium AC-409-J13_OGT_754m]|nr:RNA 2',3'-cyclic phosphodiesterase [SAR202 cluster bacterium AC-409-J13_OGT_754m]
MPKTLRLFISLNIQESIRNALNDCISNIQKKGFDEIKWVESQRIHLTLHFLGDVHKSLVYGINTQLNQIANSLQPFIVTLSDIGVFPHIENPRIVWVGIKQNSKTLNKLRNLTESKLSTLGIVTPEKPYKPHLTLGRVNRNCRISKKRLTELMQQLKCGNLQMAWKIQELHLIHSCPTSEGFEYHNIGVSRLGLKQ